MRKKILKIIILILIVLFLIFVGYFFIGKPPQAEKIIWGISFSQKHAKDLGINWKENYLALLNDLEAKNLRISAHWDLIEPEQGEYYFEDLDWQIKEAEDHKARVILIIGMKSGRWPECHLPKWAAGLTKEKQQENILKLIEKIILRYNNSNSIWAWQVENEPLFSFGDCPWIDEKFLREEVSLVKSLDFQQRPVIINTSGERSFWIKEAKIGDIVGTSLYRVAWFKELGIHIHYPIPPTFFWRRTQIIKRLFNKEVICVELQAEPWGSVLLYDLPIEEQKKTMNLEQFKKNINFAKRTGLKEFYLWGGEWWFWLKEVQKDSLIWDESKKLLR